MNVSGVDFFHVTKLTCSVSLSENGELVEGSAGGRGPETDTRETEPFHRLGQSRHMVHPATLITGGSPRAATIKRHGCRRMESEHCMPKREAFQERSSPTPATVWMTDRVHAVGEMY